MSSYVLFVGRRKIRTAAVVVSWQWRERIVTVAVPLADVTNLGDEGDVWVLFCSSRTLVLSRYHHLQDSANTILVRFKLIRPVNTWHVANMERIPIQIFVVSNVGTSGKKKCARLCLSVVDHHRSIINGEKKKFSSFLKYAISTGLAVFLCIGNCTHTAFVFFSFTKEAKKKKWFSFSRSMVEPGRPTGTSKWNGCTSPWRHNPLLIQFMHKEESKTSTKLFFCFVLKFVRLIFQGLISNKTPELKISRINVSQMKFITRQCSARFGSLLRG